MGKIRAVQQITQGEAASDGAGVRLTRMIGSPEIRELDPFLMLDVFESDNPDDYLAGFPPHPHRGFETVTYLLNGRMRHQDSMGNEAVIQPGGEQEMTAGRGVIHSEMPEQEEGLLKGFQLWINLPSHAKMQAPSYQEFAPDSVPLEQWEDGTEIRVITGKTNRGTQGPVHNEYVNPTYLDVNLAANAGFTQTVAASDNAFMMLSEGSVSVGGQQESISGKSVIILSEGDTVSMTAGDQGARFLLVAGQPINEPIARGGPFVMNTQAEIEQAFDDYRHNRF